LKVAYALHATIIDGPLPILRIFNTKLAITALIRDIAKNFAPSRGFSRTSNLMASFKFNKDRPLFAMQSSLIVAF